MWKKVFLALGLILPSFFTTVLEGFRSVPLRVSSWRTKRARGKRAAQILKECGCCCRCHSCSNPLQDRSHMEVIAPGEYRSTCDECGSLSAFNYDIAPVPILVSGHTAGSTKIC